MNHKELLIAKLFTELMLICASDHCNGLDVTIKTPFGRSKCHFVFKVETPEGDHDD